VAAEGGEVVELDHFSSGGDTGHLAQRPQRFDGRLA
jgi:hypothetical protein